MLYKNGQGARGDLGPNDFFTTLAHDMIDNEYDIHGPNVPSNIPSSSEDISPAQAQVDSVLLVETILRRKPKQGRISKHKALRRFFGYNKKTKWVCKTCCSNAEKETFVCHPMSGRDCFIKHVKENH